MADYYTLLAKAVSNLPKAGPEPARKAIYDRARKALVRQLRSLGPALSEADIAREEAALEAAIGKLEGQFSPVAPSPPSPANPRPSAPAPGAAAARPSSYIAPPRPAASAPRPPGARIPIPDTPLARPVAPVLLPALSERPSGSGAASRPAYAPSSAAARSLPPAPMGLRPAPAARYSPPPVARRAEPRYEPDPSPLGPPAADEFVDDGYAPPVEANEFERAETVGAADAGLRPSAPRRLDRPPRGAAAWILAALVIGVVLSIAVFAFLWRQNPQDLAMKEPTATPSAEATAGPGKIVERVAGAPAATSTPTAAATTAPPTNETPASAATPAATPSAAVAGAPAATPAPTAAATAPPPAAGPGVSVAARAAMLVAVATDPQKPAVTLGSVVWSAIPAAPGQPASTVAVKAEADIPDLKMHAVMTLRKNADASLPASHTIDLRVTFGDGAEIKGIKDMRVPMMRRDDPRRRMRSPACG